jgi:hypothetical protein
LLGHSGAHPLPTFSRDEIVNLLQAED